MDFNRSVLEEVDFIEALELPLSPNLGGSNVKCISKPTSFFADSIVLGKHHLTEGLELE